MLCLRVLESICQVFNWFSVPDGWRLLHGTLLCFMYPVKNIQIIPSYGLPMEFIDLPMTFDEKVGLKTLLFPD